ncbi:hypothetical protein Tco_1062282 [Tanacetum coccineum]
MGEGSVIPTDPHHTPTFIQPSTQPQKTQKPRKPKRKDTQVPQPSDPTKSVADEAVHKELGDSGGPRCQETIGDTITQTRFKNVSKHSNDLLLARGNTLQNDEDRLKLDELMALCTTLKNRVLDLEKTKTTQHNEIASLKRMVKKLEKKNSEESLGEDASKQERIDAIDADEEITMVSVQNVDEEMFDVNVLDGEEVFVVEQEVAANKENDEVNVVEEVVQVSVAALMEIKSTKPKEKGVVIQELGESTTTISSQLSSQQSHDKGKGILIEPVKPMKKKDQILHDEETAIKLQAEFDEKERLAR